MPQAYRPLPDAQLLWETFSYNPLTGQLYRKDGKPAGHTALNRYIGVSVGNCQYYAHRVIWKWCHGTDPAAMVDHINGVRAANQIWNLRQCNMVQIAANATKHRDNASGYKGVYLRKDRIRPRWVAKLGNRRIGTFDTPEEAHAAYCAKATELHGHFHRAA